ncbi:hypothetical protein ENUP19_0248G0091 [Entamoeba nuttalli]|uniref:4-alpha-glucanotransferase n=2 Tax=Entamoeba nuttalli TaxID=412467 RepID=K2G5G0_ENTNP|nr:4-alpha-glucanotransferase, putative [Entamoeba nuttalli P19]EKE37561.1 4-alpha-glucanotransferase, putative [Entamoeba nuttalli P19]|eukprot:XP_008860087.1 4-alpha-glucanotransferase, putative [Entamoeba nuttalli P19]
MVFITIHYSTPFGQAVCLEVSGEKKVYKLNYVDNNTWSGEVKFESTGLINYRYLITKEDDLTEIFRTEGSKESYPHSLDLTNLNSFDKVEVNDIFISGFDAEDTFLTTSYFRKVIYGKRPQEKLVIKKLGKTTLLLKVRCTCVPEGQCVFVGGAIESLGKWDVSKAIKMTPTHVPYYEALIDISNETTSFEYKCFIADANSRANARWEDRSNRVYYIAPVAEEETEEKTKPVDTLIVKEDNDFSGLYYRGAAVVTPVFSLRTKASCGCGEFLDLKKVVDWCNITGLSLIQTLPVNDTTVYFTWRDSYPYNPNSVQALHPMYLRLSSLTQDPEILAEINSVAQKLNALEQIDYEAVLKEKETITRKIFSKVGTTQKGFDEFKKNAGKWLIPYCVYRALIKSVDTPLPPTPKDFAEVEAMYDANKAECDYYAFVQYNLHLQLKEASDYAADHKVALKGDLPIGVSKRSVECWMYPNLFHLDKSTGAPPDYFSAGEGQNWGFPTYNWDNMAKDDYAWWKGRLSQMSQYFNAYRIDHILGFFRIWAIPAIHRTGLLGRFSPDLPFSRQELEGYGIYDTDRLSYPYIRDHTLDSLFGDEKNFVISKFLVNNYNGTYNLKPEFQSEGAILEKTGLSPQFRESDKKIVNGLKLLLQNVCLIRDEQNPNLFVPRIDMEKTYSSFNELDHWVQEGLKRLYNDYFYKRHEGLWEATARKRLPAMARASNMLVCGEDLGMVPDCVVRVMNDMKINCLRIQRLTDTPNTLFYHPADYQYLTVSAPSGHDMSTIRGWWEEDRYKTQYFWEHLLGRSGAAPFTCPIDAVKTIFDMHLYGPAMLACFPLQDILSLKLKYIEGRDPKLEQINDPSNPIHYWRYRCHVDMDEIIADNELNNELRTAVEKSGRHLF